MIEAWRRYLLYILLFGAVGLGAELYLLGHYEDRKLHPNFSGLELATDEPQSARWPALAPVGAMILLSACSVYSSPSSTRLPAARSAVAPGAMIAPARYD